QGAGRPGAGRRRCAAALWRVGQRQQCRGIAGGGRRRRRAGGRCQPESRRIFGYRQSGLKRLEAPAKMDNVKAFLHEWRVVLLMIHVIITSAMIVVILLQRSEGGGLGMGRTDALFSVRGQANVLSRATAIFAGLFFFLSLLMAWSVGTATRSTTSIMDRVPASP